MRKLYWIITNRCNLGCKYCYYNTSLEKRILDRLDLSKIDHVLKQISPFFNEVILTGGEPLIIPEIFELIRRCKNSGLRIGILTNGVLLNKENCHKLKNLRVDTVSISLDSFSSEINDYQRGNTDLVLRGIKNILSVRTNNMVVEIMQTVTKMNLTSIRPLVKFCQKNNINLWLGPVEINTKKENIKNLNLRLCTHTELIYLKKEMYKWAKKTNNKYLKEYVDNCISLIKDEKPKNISCPMGNLHFLLEINGNMYPCFLRKDVYLGNIYNEKIENILNNPKLKSQKKFLEEARCVKLGCLCMTISGKYN